MTEVVIYYHLYNKKSGTIDISQGFPRTIELKESERVSTFFLKLSKISATVGAVIILLFYAPAALAWGKGVISTVNKNFGISTSEVQQIENSKNVSKSTYKPSIDPTLPKTNRLVIPSIGVNTNIQEATLDNYESALKNGVWRVSDFGEPDDNSEPIILAAHRFGYLAWTNSFRYESSFYNLPKVKDGDTIEIDWKQRKYSYGVYATNKGTQITDYTSDLILYTCETLTGSEKLFVYARLLQV